MAKYPKQIIYGVYAIVIIALVVVIYLAFNSSSTKPKQPSSVHPKVAQSKVVPRPSGSSNTQADTTQPPSQPNSASSSTTSLTNTGPGDVVGLFTVVSIISGISYHLFSLRKLRQKSS
jgi:cytoskeletal protein RodZ